MVWFLLGAISSILVYLATKWFARRVLQDACRSTVGKKVGWKLTDMVAGPGEYIELRRTEAGRKEQWIKMPDRAELHLVLEVISKYLKRGAASRCHPERRS